MKKSAVTVLLILTLACLLLPAAALAAGEVMIAGTTLSANTYYVNNGAGNGITTTGASASTYNAYLDSTGKTLYLNGLNVQEPSCNRGSYYYVIAANEIGSMTLVLEGDSTIRTQASKQADTYHYKTAAIYINGGDLTIKGSGKLTATGNETDLELSCGIFINDGNLTVESGTVIATGGSLTGNQGGNPEGSFGVYANWAVNVTGGTLKGYGGVSSKTSRGVSTGSHGHGSPYSCDVSVSGGGILEGHGGKASKTSYGVYADYRMDVGNGSITGTGGDLTGNTGEANSSYGVYSGRIVNVTGALTGTGGKVELGTGNGNAATSIGVQCGGEVNVNNGSLTGTGKAAVAITNDAVSIGVDVSSSLTVTGNSGSVIGNGGASSKTSGTGGAFSYGVRCDGSVVVGSSSAVQTAALSGTGGTANDTSGNDNSRSFGVCGTASTGAFTVNEGATLTGNGGAAFNSNGVFTGNKACAVKGTLNGTGNATSSGASYGVNVGSGSIDLSGSMTARANGGGTGNASASIGVSAGGGIHLTGQGYLLTSTAAVALDDDHNAKRPRTYDGQNALTAEDAAVWRQDANAPFQSIATYRAGYEDGAYRSRLEVRNAGNGLTATPGSWNFATRTQGSTLPLPDAKEFTVENTSGVALSLSADTLTDYTVTLSKTSLAAGESMQVTVQPNATALNATGNHAVTLTLRGSPGEAQVEIPLSFPVNAAPTVTLDASPTVVASGAEVVLTAQAAQGTTPYQEYEWKIRLASGGTTTQTTGGTVNTLKVYPTERTFYSVRVTDDCGVENTSSEKRVDIATYTISVAPASLSFGVVQEGYTPPAAQTVTVRNTGNMVVHLNAVSSTNFIATDFGTSTLATGNTTTFTLRPKPGWTVGDHSETLLITTTEGGSTTLPVSFFVTSASAPSIMMQPGTTYPVGQSGRDYEVIIGAGTPAAALGAANLTGLTVRRSDGADFSPAFGTDYGKRDGSVIITLYEAYLNRLPVGAYTLTATIEGGVYAGQRPSLSFRVTERAADGAAPTLPQTGDSARPVLWLALLCLAGAGAAVLGAAKRPSRRGARGR